MFKKVLVAAAAALSIGGAMAATSASAEPHGWRGGWHERGGWHDHDGWRGGWGRGGFGWRAPGVYVGPTWGYSGGCGWRWSRYYGRYVRACW